MIIPKKAYSTFVLIIIFCWAAIIARTRYNPIVWLVSAFSHQPEVVVPYTTHIVLFQFKEGTSSIAIKEITSKMLGLKKACLHPGTGSPYILSISGGKDNSIENLQRGMTHAFVLQFYSNEHRDYYVDHDPVHRAFKEAAAAVLQRAQVVDFQNGVFTTET